MKPSRLSLSLAILATLSACGGGGSSGGGTTPTPTPTPTSSACSITARKDWALQQMREWYLFPETLPASLDPAPYTDLLDYVDALTATARSQGRDRYFTYTTSIQEENAYYNSGSSAGFGFRLAADYGGTRIFITESFEGAPALAAGVDRGAEILAIGTSSGSLRTVSAIVASEGLSGVSNALGPDTAGTTRVFRISDASGTRNVTLAKADFTLQPISSRYGAQIINDGTGSYGYLNLRTFISTADPVLRDAFAMFRAQGVTQVIVDLRYNGGGLVSTASVLGDLLGGDRSTSDVFTRMTFRPEKSAENETITFDPQPQSIAPTRIAFIGSQGTASASELVINAFIPYLGANAALIGGNTYGKPVGQIAVDRSECDDRLRVIAFATQNSAGNADYYTGLAGSLPTCRADDDISYALGDPNEGMTRQAIEFLKGNSCSPISGGVTAQSARSHDQVELLTPARPSPAQRETPGLF